MEKEYLERLVKVEQRSQSNTKRLDDDKNKFRYFKANRRI
jgi:hypothetical protein